MEAGAGERAENGRLEGVAGWGVSLSASVPKLGALGFRSHKLGSLSQVT